MKKRLNGKFIFFAILTVLFSGFYIQGMQVMQVCEKRSDIVKIFPDKPEKIKELATRFMKEDREKIAKIISIKKENRTFESTVLALDRVSSFSNLVILCKSLLCLKKVSPLEAVRDAARDEKLKIEKFQIEEIKNNKKLYEALKEYEAVSYKDNLFGEKKYFLEETMKSYKRAGLGLPEEELKVAKKLQKEIKELEQQFAKNISDDGTIIVVREKDLAGVDKEFVASLKKSDMGDVVLDMDYPTVFRVLGSCKCEETRKVMYVAFKNRAYPENKKILQGLMERRDTLARLLGAKSFAHLDLEDQMAKDPETVKKFLQELYEKTQKKAKQEFDLLSQNLPEGVTLTQDSKIKPWDFSYIKNCYKKKNFNIDMEKVAEYFPMEHVLKESFKIYEQFFGIKFKLSQPDDLWHKDVTLVEVYSSENALLGYILLDLYPREKKYRHACSEQVLPPVQGYGPAVNMVITNFPKPTKNKPSLLKLGNVRTLWHELGHALHDILGRTQMAKFSGFYVKMDFCEMPSQMLEQWPYEKEILEKISCHYKTGEFLPYETIQKIVALNRFDTGNLLQRQCFLSFLALQYFSANQEKDPKKIYSDLRSNLWEHVAMCEDENMYAAFGHLGDHEYASKYYGYLWADVFAIDIFYAIKKQGLLNTEVGKRYVQEILSKGGSQDPTVMVKNFLGRDPSQEAFLHKKGLLEGQEGFEVLVEGRKRDQEQVGIVDRNSKRRKVYI